jgi:hypothetical protein
MIRIISKVSIDKHLSEVSLIHSWLKQDDAAFLLLFTSVFVYASGEVTKHKIRL